MADETAPDWRVDLSYQLPKGGSPETIEDGAQETS